MSEDVKTTAAAPARPQGDRPARPQGDRPARPQGDRPARPQGDRPRRPQGDGGRFQRRRKFCKFCADTSLTIDHKDPDMLRGFITERCKILPSRVTGTCAKHQRSLTTAVKRARVLALLAFTPLHHD
ncbi:30S ribosomal protein S18 [Mariprofundus sp. KV]|uniref:30S ribosomal protein S18 n=1 Tax=Mariprofundus sp. KV TaxID=2608715 RepID=UPI0015A3D621|nr:30S ribosomal protein S18 [Mariprofundus sp. KV]